MADQKNNFFPNFPAISFAMSVNDFRRTCVIKSAAYPFLLYSAIFFVRLIFNFKMYKNTGGCLSQVLLWLL